MGQTRWRGWGGGRVLYPLVTAHSWQLYSAASLEHQAASTMTCYPTQSNYPDTELTSSCHILIMPNPRLGSEKDQFLSLWFDSTRFWTRRLQTRAHDLRIPRSPRMGGGHSTHSAILTGPLDVGGRTTVGINTICSIVCTRCSGRSGKAKASCVEGWDFDFKSSQTNDLQNRYMSLTSLVLGINRKEWGLVSSVSGYR